MTKEKRIFWEKKFNIHYAYNNDGDRLGYFELERVGRHMHWKWYQYEDIGMTGGCIDEMRQKQKELFKDRLKKDE